MDREMSEDTRLLYCTTGVLLQKLINDKNMHRFTHVILDEVTYLFCHCPRWPTESAWVGFWSLSVCVCLFVTGTICPKGSSAGISFTHGPILGHVAPIKVKFGTEELLLPAKFDLDRFRGGGLRPQNWKKSNFTNIIAHKGRIPCTIFTKFISFMRVLSLHNSAKFGCFISINDKIINNGGDFSQIFDAP